MKTLVIIPSRLSATRLPGKPLLKINGLSVISHVYKRAEEANIGEVYVATEDQEIVDDVIKNGGKAILTSNNHKTGTDRIYEALIKLNKLNIEFVINLQGDEPLMNVDDIKKLHHLMLKSDVEIGTLGSIITDANLHKNQNIVKVATKNNLKKTEFSKAENFMRLSKSVYQNIYHHLGIYCYRTEILKKFISLDQTTNEVENKLEQLRALDNDINISVGLAKSNPIGIDTEEDFVAIKKIMEYKT